MSLLWRKTIVNWPIFLLPVLWSLFTNWWTSKNGDRITLDKNEIIYGVTDNFARHLGLNLCMIIGNVRKSPTVANPLHERY